MKRLLAIVALLVGLIAPAHAQTQVESVRVPFGVLVSPDFMVEEPGGCWLWDSRFPLLEGHPTPYSQLLDTFNYPGRIVNADQSPVPGQAGCLFELNLELEPGYSYDFRIVHSQRGWEINAGTMTFGDIILYAPDTIVFVLDQVAFDTGTVSAVGSEQAEVPDYPATIEAQQVEIESLKATIEALETPAP